MSFARTLMSIVALILVAGAMGMDMSGMDHDDEHADEPWPLT